MSKKPRKRGRPAKKIPDRVDAPPKRIAEALFAGSDHKVKKRTKK